MDDGWWEVIWWSVLTWMIMLLCVLFNLPPFFWGTILFSLAFLYAFFRYLKKRKGVK